MSVDKGEIIAWEQAIKITYPQISSIMRYAMNPLSNQGREKELEQITRNIPNRYVISEFDEKAWNEKPFGHGQNYMDYAEFQARGSGAIIYNQQRIVSSASSYVSFQNEVELDVSTLPEYRRMGLGIACAAKMLLQCQKKNQVVHWDAQNLASKHMAEKLGFTLEREYKAYCFYLPKEI